MKIPKRIMGKISRIIRDTSALYSQAIPDTQKHLFPQLLFGLLTAGSVYASDVARKIEGTSIGAKEMMDAIEKVRDGSDPQEETKFGYWLNEVYISPKEE